MNTIKKILKQHATVYDPHNQIKESLKTNKKLYGIFSLILLEVLVAALLIYLEKELYALLMLFFYIITIIIGSYLHFKHVENLYGSIENFDIEKLKIFRDLVLQESNIDLINDSENNLIESLIKDRLDKVHRLEQAKKNIYLGLLTVVLPFLISLLIKNFSNVLFLTLSIMAIGLIMAFFSIKSALKEYTTISKLEHISELLKELKLLELVESRNLSSHLNDQNNNMTE